MIKNYDEKYVRTCEVYDLLKAGKINSKNQALKLLEEKHGKKSNIKNTLEIWLKGPLKEINEIRGNEK